MAKFRKKPVVIEAMQYDVGNPSLALDFLGSANCTLDDMGLIIRTLEGDMTVGPGDWIIKGVKGEFYPCKLDIFEATYESIEVEEVCRGAC